MADNPAGRVPVSQVVRDAYAFMIANWRRMVPAAVVLGLCVGAGEVLTILSQAPSAPPEQAIPGFLAGMIIQMLAGAAYSACVLRLAVREEYVGRFGLSFGADELRLLGAALSVALLLLPLLLIAVIILSSLSLGPMIAAGEDPSQYAGDPRALMQAIAESLDPARAALIVFAGLLLLAALIVLGVRLALVNAATIGERRIVVLQTWPWSRGNIRRMIVVLLLTLPPTLVCALLVQGLAEMILNVGGETAPASFAVVGGLAAALQAIASLPTIAAGAELYKGLRPSDFTPR
ncbi:MAG: hypothetical protein KGS00_12935 [Alphaproteobacteria bacterium]|nr:hypothetical protein [Alphaproteobacteria bacterium]